MSERRAAPRIFLSNVFPKFVVKIGLVLRKCVGSYCLKFSHWQWQTDPIEIHRSDARVKMMVRG
jgi:hypothetical protein